MRSIFNFYNEAFLAMASYATNLQAGSLATSNQAEQLAVAGVTATHLTEFSRNQGVAVLTQFEGASGASMTLFKQADGYHLAIRGTEPSAADLLTDGLLAIGQPMSSNPQFIALKAKLLEWVNGSNARSPKLYRMPPKVM